MSTTRKQYPFPEFESRWQSHWKTEGTFHVSNPGDPGFDASKPKYYILDMFPYPSGEGLHVGHTEGYTATDILARYQRLRGKNVLHPMGWDAFGLPAEQYAIKTGQHPAITTKQNIDRFRGQLERVGFSYDWSREINTTDVDYYRWTQWIFLQLYNAWFDPEANAARPIAACETQFLAANPGATPEALRAHLDVHRLAYISEMPVNWCPALGTVLANEEVVDGKSEVGGFPVERRPMRQWMLRITAYAQRLIDELDEVDWPPHIKTLQRNWIGRSDGALVRFTVAGRSEEIEVFTTRPDTLFGATYMVLAPEHPLVPLITSSEQSQAVTDYQTEVRAKSDLERTDLAETKSGVFTGASAINPANGKSIPIWIADYVLMGYGTGAIMAVPAHDTRDWEFAYAFGLPIRQVVSEDGIAAELTACFEEDGIATQSSFLDGLPTPEAKAKMLDWLEQEGKGGRRIQFKLRDWLFSRQRYWGEPFPIIWTPDGNHHALPESTLPLCPPELEDFKPTGTGEPPLAKARDWVELADGSIRETNTMPQWAGSCWYYLRFCDPKNETRFVAKAAEQYWLEDGVDLYVGGTEHAVLHLLYARFWHKVLFDLGHVATREPFRKLVNQGMILGEDSHKMSKSRGNVVNPDTVIEEYGADSLRLYEMFMGPLEQMKPWSMSGVEGVYRFLARVWRLCMLEDKDGAWVLNPELQDVPVDPALARVLHATIKKVTEDLDELKFNTAISQMMVCVNTLTGVKPRPLEAVRTLLILLNPFAPHLTEELNRLIGGKTGLSYDPWPNWDESLLVETSVEIVLQVNGKLRAKILVDKDATHEAIETAALAQPSIIEALAGNPPKKVIVVPGKLVNVVI